MYIYSLIYFVNSLGFFGNERTKRILKVSVLLMLIFISGTRYYMGGSDVYVYENTYNGVPSVGAVLKFYFTGVNNGVNENYEIGFLLLCAIIKSLHFTYFGFILIYTIIFYYLMIEGLKEFAPNWFAFFAVFIYKLMFYDTFISIRQGLTIAMFCYMLKFIRDRKWYIYFPLCYLAFLEHRGALILFPLYFINYMPVSKNFIKYYAIAFAPTWLIRNAVDLSGIMENITSFIDNKHALEQWVDSNESISIIHTIECYAVVILILIFYEKIMSNKKNKEAKLVLQLFMVSIPIFTLFSKWIFLTREKDYFVLMYGIIFGYVLNGGTTSVITSEYNYNRDKKGINNFKIIAVIIIIACYIGMFRFVYRFDGGVLMNYESFLFKDVSIFDWS